MTLPLSEISPPRWDLIDDVLLDMDGTLLDKHFDDHFWEEYVPRQYAQINGISDEEATEKLLRRFRSLEGTLNWTDLDFWSRELGLDIPALKRQVDHLIAIHPFVIQFLDSVRSAGKRVYLVTNAHGKTVDLKMEKTSLAGKFHGIFTSQQFGAPKEDLDCWDTMREMIGFDPARTLLAEDTLAVLDTAARFGIRYLVHIANANSVRGPQTTDRYFSIKTFGEIMP